jgi:hypothetical protein
MLGVGDVEERKDVSEVREQRPVQGGGEVTATVGNYIDLFTVDGSWMVRFRGPHAKEIGKLFDGDTLPTAFTAVMPYVEVKARIEKLNPAATVSCQHRNTRTVFGVGAIVCDDCGFRW